ncbi:Het-C-domain-containing protein [Xylona heveae TC161]|uniref:Het-C-domain-containing protein n=1 Tax=Xylona heveae (strain CBS 132557 / TC161) TaxID=1328760 RepID=A0A164ZQ11_XYLHT|nr:Het-C-domain-containing protein [Xylona heveae TC161]KZF19361.1 Het-C-domain-containing protein [Xylona heveae TC161]
MASRLTWLVIVAALLLVILPSPAAAFGAGNIASISKIEGQNWRHGDIEDMLKKVAFIKHHKWTSLMISRAYFGNWLRDYSQAVDVGTLKGVQAGTLRILVWILGFMSFGYATAEFEVTEERLGVYRPEEHIDNPKDYADNVDARQYDSRLRGPVSPEELAIDPRTGMKNYIANESGGWATSSGYVKHSFARSIHFGRVYTNGPRGVKGKEADLCEALRCLGQGLHTLEDFGAHTNYTELALRELGFTNVFPHVGAATEIQIGHKRIFPLVTGTFGGVDFLHSVLGEANDHFAQTEVNEMDIALNEAQQKSHGSSSGAGARSFGNNPGQEASFFTSLLSQIPGTSGLCAEAARLQADSDAQEQSNRAGAGGEYYGGMSRAADPNAVQTSFPAPPGSTGGPPGPGIPGMSPNFDPLKTAAQIYPILEFRDKVVKKISGIIEKIPGLEALIEKITETLTLFVLSLLAPYIRPIIEAVSKQLKTGSSAVIDSSGKHQYEVWTDPHCSDPTHSMLSKDHFANILNEPAGQVASAILQYVAPRVIYAWEHPDVPVDQVLDDVIRVFHHPALRDQHLEIHKTMFDVVQRWAHAQPHRGQRLNDILSSESVREGHNLTAVGAGQGQGHGHGHGGHSHGSVSASASSGHASPYPGYAAPTPPPYFPQSQSQSPYPPQSQSPYPPGSCPPQPYDSHPPGSYPPQSYDPQSYPPGSYPPGEAYPPQQAAYGDRPYDPYGAAPPGAPPVPAPSSSSGGYDQPAYGSYDSQPPAYPYQQAPPPPGRPGGPGGPGGPGQAHWGGQSYGYGGSGGGGGGY